MWWNSVSDQKYVQFSRSGKTSRFANVIYDAMGRIEQEGAHINRVRAAFTIMLGSYLFVLGVARPFCNRLPFS